MRLNLNESCNVVVRAHKQHSYVYVVPYIVLFSPFLSTYMYIV